MNSTTVPLPAATVFVGADVSERHVDLAFVDEAGRDLRPVLCVTNDPTGLRRLVEVVCQLAAGGRVLVGAESTGVLHKALLRAVHGVADVVELNPKVIARFVELELRGSRSDKTDARSIARYLRTFRPEPTMFADADRADLVRAVRLRRTRVQERSRSLCRLRRQLTELVPGFGARFRKVPRWLVRTLRVASHPDALLSLAEEERGRCGVTRATSQWEAFCELLRAAPRQAWGLLTRTALRQLAGEIALAYADVEELDAGIEAWLREHAPDHVLHSVPGAGPLTVATMLAEVGDVRRFADVDHFIGYCGLYPASKQSGQADWRGRMVRKGNRNLRTQLLLASTTARQHNQPIKAFYARLRNSGKSTRVAGGAAARKFAAQLFAVWRTGRPFDPDHGA